MTENSHRYLKEIEMREEAGTPAIVGAIRAGLVFQLKQVKDAGYRKYLNHSDIQSMPRCADM